MTHIFLSPHLDDAALSCGGLIHQLTERGDTVLILNIMAGDPPSKGPTSALVDELHTRWAAGDSPMAQRRDEDQAAAGVLQAQTAYLSVPDAPYRVDESGTVLYPDETALFSEPSPNDPAWGLNLPIPPQTTAIYAPLGVGGHVDHRLVSRLARQMTGATVFFYEDYPYSAHTGEALYNNDGRAERLVGLEALHDALASFGGSLVPYAILLSETDLLAKIGAISCYHSQISTFWPDEIAMKASVRRHAQALAADNPAGAERLWVWKE